MVMDDDDHGDDDDGDDGGDDGDGDDDTDDTDGDGDGYRYGGPSCQPLRVTKSGRKGDGEGTRTCKHRKLIRGSVLR